MRSVRQLCLQTTLSARRGEGIRLAIPTRRDAEGQGGTDLLLRPGFQSFYNRQKALISALALSMLLKHASKERGKALSLRRQRSKNTHTARLDEYNGLEHVRRCKWMLPLQTKQHSRTSSLLRRSSVTQGKKKKPSRVFSLSAIGFVMHIRHYYTWALSSSSITAQA